jgi:glucoamylase
MHARTALLFAPLLSTFSCSSGGGRGTGGASAAGAAALEPAAAPVAEQAPGAPGEVSTWTSGAKEAVGTSATPASKVWFTLHGGVLTEVYYPRLDVANVRTLEIAVSDGKNLWLESKDLEHSIEQVDERALLFVQVSRHPKGLFALRKTYATDPAGDALLVEVSFEQRRGGGPGYDLYVLYDPSLRNSCTGDSGFVEKDALLAQDGDVASALVASPPFVLASTGFEGPSDARADLARNRRLTAAYRRSEGGNIVQVARLPRGSRFTLALGFGKSTAGALESARSSLGRGFAAVEGAYAATWRRYLEPLRRPAEPRYRRAFALAAMVLAAHEDKTHRGAMIASMSIPWGGRVRADRSDIGGYHLVWSRDLYQVATAFLAMGDRGSAGRALDYLFEVQQREDGSFPQNTWLDGRPYWKSLQMDEVAFPIVLAWQLGRADRATFEKHVRPAARYIAEHGPATPQERWEEEAGYSPSTIAAEIAGLVCAADLARRSGDDASAALWERTADGWAGNLEKWLYTTTGKLDDRARAKGHYLRINDDRDPDDGAPLEINNGGGTFDEREIVDAGFLELVRLGIRRADDPAVLRSLEVVDKVIRVETPRGTGYRRYNHDGYGEKPDGSGFDGSGVGRLWPILTGERGEYEVARGGDPRPQIEAMLVAVQGGRGDRQRDAPRVEHGPARAAHPLGRG